MGTLVDPAGFEPATWRVQGDVVFPAFAAIFLSWGRGDDGWRDMPHALTVELRAESPAGFEPATLKPHVVPAAFATALFHTSISFTSETQSRSSSPLAKRESVSNTESEKPPTLRMSLRSFACVVP